MSSGKHVSLILLLFFTCACPKIASIAAPLKSQDCSKSIQSSVLQQFSNAKMRVSSKLLNDYGKLHVGERCYVEAWPKDAKSVSELVHYAYQHNIGIRMIGNGHSGNGSSLPRMFELLIHTDQLNKLTFNKEGEVLVDAGIPMFLVQQYIEKVSDYSLPVTNVGGLAATLGGFISAGGISDTSDQYGGFWNHVLQIKMVTGDGKIVTIQPDHQLFSWLFGSMGQFGVIVEARLKLIPKQGTKGHRYPLNLQYHIDYEHDDYFNQKHQPLYWFNLLVTAAQFAQGMEDLTKLQSRYPGLLLSIPIYDWPINNNKFVPPLIFPQSQDFHAIGIWGRPGERFSQARLLQLENEFEQLVASRHYRTYVQAELLYTPKKYQAYFGSSLYDQYFAIKKQVDPKLLFNRGSVFQY